ncbi:MAG: hypothetical protein Q9207_007067 [Kuettlingeria erythrocarpa]
MAEYFSDDLCALKSDPSITGLVTRTWHDVSPTPLDADGDYFMHKDFPGHLRLQVKRTRQLPKGYATLEVDKLGMMELLVREDDLVLIDRHFSRGDVVKRNPLDPESGTVIGSFTASTLQPSFAIFKDELSSQTKFVGLESSPISQVEMHDLARFQKYSPGDLVVYHDWLGTIEHVHERVIVALDEGGVVMVSDADYVEEIIRLPRTLSLVYEKFNGDAQGNHLAVPAKPCHHGQKVRIASKVLSKSRWLLGSYKRHMKTQGVVINVLCDLAEIDWRVHRAHGGSTSDTSIKPDRFMHMDPVEGRMPFSTYDLSRHPSLDHLAVSPSFVSAGENVRLRDAKTAEIKYGCHLESIAQRPVLSMPWTTYAPFEGSVLLAQVTSTTSTVKIRWQDDGITEEPSSSIFPYDEVDDHDVWPGELVSRKDQEESYDNPSYEKLIRTRAIGVVQSVNAVERVALVRWYDSADITITGEGHDRFVRSDSYLGKITDEITEVSVFEVEAHEAINRRRGDTVYITASKSGQEGSRGQCQQVTQNEDDWYGEVVDLLLDGHVLVRLGGLDNVRDVACSVLDLVVVSSADDDTTETDSLDTDMCDDEHVMNRSSLISGSTRHLAETAVEYDGSSPSNPGSDEEDQWMTDSNSDTESPIQAPSPQRPETTAMSTTKRGSKSLTSHLNGFSYSGCSEEPQGGDGASPQPSTAPIPFEILDGVCPQHTFGADSDGKSGKWLKTVLREHQILRSSLPDGVYVRTWESSLEFMRVLIVGPSGTPYALAPFLFDIHLNKNFPYRAPSVFFHSWTNGIGRVNPNLYEDGKVCLSLLGTWSSEKDNEEWVPLKSSILQIIVSLLGLVLVKEPFYNEAGFEALQGTERSKHTSALYSEKAFVLSRRFVSHAMETLPAGFDGIIRWLYSPSSNGPCMLQTVLEDCRIFLEVGSLASSDQTLQNLQQYLDKYCIPLPRLSQGALLLLRKTMPDLESLFNDAIKFAANGRESQVKKPDSMEL